MDPRLFSSITQLSNAELLANVKRLAARERQATATLIAHLAELDERRLYLAEGYSSLFIYCTQVLNLSEHAAYGRIEAARAARKFPVLLKRLSDGSVTLTTIRLLAAHLTLENHHDLLARARHQTKRAVEELVAHLRPRPSVPGTIRRLPAPRYCAGSSAMGRDARLGLTPCAESQESVDGEDGAVSGPPSAPAPAAGRPATVTPLSPERYKLQCTVSAETKGKLRQAQALLRHQVPNGDVAMIIDRALTALLEQVAKQKLATTGRSRPIDKDATDSTSRHIPNAVKRAVWIRDSGRCAFVSKGGRRCSEDGFLEFHHVKPYAAHGEATTENIQLRCRAHNGYEAELYFGPSTSTKVKEAQAPYGTRTTHRASHRLALQQLAPDRVRPEIVESPVRSGSQLFEGNTHHPPLSRPPKAR